MTESKLYEQYEKYCFSLARSTGVLNTLVDRIDKIEQSGVFNDMLFLADSIVSEFVKYQWKDMGDVNGEWRESCSDLEMSLDSNYYRFYVRKLKSKDGIEFAGLHNSTARTITIAPGFIDKDDVIMHELIHAHEAIINQRAPFHHDILTVCLYKDILNKIPDVDARIIHHTHVIRGDEISRRGGSHDVLFFLKSLDLDVRCGYKLGTVCGYGRDEFQE